MDTNIVTLITGGGRGIGKAIALRMAKETPVLIVGTDPISLMRTCEEIADAGGIADHVAGDVTHQSTMKKCRTRLHRTGRTVKHLVCNAGIGRGGNTHEFSPAMFAHIMNVNVNGAFNFVQPCLPDIIENKGTIILMSSTLGVQGYKRQAAYVASKHALVGLAKSLAHEYASRGVTVVPVCPTFVDTDMTRQTIDSLMRHQGMTEAEAIAKIAATNPQKRIIPAEEVAEMVAFICSGKCSSMNGNPIIMSGGN